MAFELLQERHGGVLVIAPRGRLDNDSASDFELAAQELLAAGEQHLVVDLAQLNYVSNAGLRVLGMLGKALKSPATSLRLCGLTPAVRQVFDAAGVSVMFDVRPDLARALADHPAARGADELVQHASRLLGLLGARSEAPAVAPAGIGNLAKLAAELLAGGGSQPRAARAMAAGTQMVPRVRSEDVARAQAQADATGGKKPSWLQRLLGKG